MYAFIVISFVILIRHPLFSVHIVDMQTFPANGHYEILGETACAFVQIAGQIRNFELLHEIEPVFNRQFSVRADFWIFKVGSIFFEGELSFA